MERELWKTLYLLAVRLDNPWGHWRYSTAEVLGAYFWAVVHDRPTSWAANPAEWPDDLRPTWLPPQSTLSRRLRRPETVELMTVVEQYLVGLMALGQYLLHRIDAKALAVSKISTDPDIGYGRGTGAYQKGYKLYCVWSRGPMPEAWGLAPMNVSEKTMARRLIPTLVGGGYLLGDPEYDANPLYDLAAEGGFQLVAKKRKDRGRGRLGTSSPKPRSTAFHRTAANGIRARAFQSTQCDRMPLWNTDFNGRGTCPVASVGTSLSPRTALGAGQNPCRRHTLADFTRTTKASICIILQRLWACYQALRLTSDVCDPLSGGLAAGDALGDADAVVGVAG